jgi:3,4-dihydroxy 2-butanone 4-phosphate synthase / GTP cyclohydrolase II
VINVVERVETAIEALRSGRLVILADDADREDEGDLVLAAQFATPESINFMAKHGRGLICLAMAPQLLDRLGLAPMVQNNESSLGTAFTVSIGSRSGITTGISAFDRAHTIQTAIAEGTTREDLVVPGHVFPLRARAGGVLVRAGHTEGSVDLAKLAGLRPAAAICEILKEDGSMARQGDLETFSRTHNIPMLSIADLILYRLNHDSSLLREIGVEELGPYSGHRLTLHRFASSVDDAEHWAFVIGDEEELSSQTCRVRVQKSDPLTEMLDGLGRGTHPFKNIFDRLAEAEAGVFVYLRSASPYRPAETSNDATDDEHFRNYGVGAQILRRLGVKRMEVLTNHPKKLVGLDGFGLEAVGSCALADLSPSESSKKGIS